ncbi:LTA synthase family protein [Solimonas soli]|uniref:LTA synthase family protein n=1 Tax=Solimonas soli TaxID=413479 RepID=UPI0004AF920A|nr:LTA synthase family protein [Solimonas soli]
MAVIPGPVAGRFETESETQRAENSLGRYRVLLTLLIAYLAVGALTRVVLWAVFSHGEHVGLPRLLVAVLPVGALNDLAESIYLLAPVGFVLWLAPRRLFAAPGGLRLVGIVSGLVVYGMLYLAAMEYFFFDEFNARFNLVAVDYLIYPTEVIGNIRDTYPVGTISAALGVLTALLCWALWRWLKPAPEQKAPGFLARSGWFALHLVAIAAVVGIVRADTLNVFDNRVANELADNGPANFFSAFRTNQLEYPQFYQTIDTARANALLRADLARGGVPFKSADPSTVTRAFPARADGLGKLNVVVITEESLGAEFVGAYGDPRGLTPRFDGLAKQGLLFTHTYATGTRTVRGLEAISASFPPIPSESIVKRPGYENVVTWGEVLQRHGYQTSFVYGGYGSFDNMNAYFSGNGFAISDRAEIPNPKFANIWGVSDEDLFLHAVDYYDARAREGKPFFSIIMSTSNHKPFTFPDGVPGVKPRGGGRSAGARYADYAIGRFFDEASRHDWYRNTVFVIVADHDARVYGAADVPLHSYEIPLLIVAPGHLQPQRIDTLTSQLDIAPTVMGLLGLPYEAPFFGQDVLHWNGGPRTLLFNHNHDVAVLREGEMAILGLNREVDVQSYHRKAGPPSRDVDDFHPAPFDQNLVDLAVAYYQTGYRLFTQPGGVR